MNVWAIFKKVHNVSLMHSMAHCTLFLRLFCHTVVCLGLVFTQLPLNGWVTWREQKRGSVAVCYPVMWPLTPSSNPCQRSQSPSTVFPAEFSPHLDCYAAKPILNPINQQTKAKLVDIKWYNKNNFCLCMCILQVKRVSRVCNSSKVSSTRLFQAKC